MGLDLPLCFEDIEDVLEVIIKNEKLQNPKVTFSQGSKIGEGFIGINTAVEITDGNKTMHFFVKAAPKHEKLRQFGQIKETYTNELHFYKVIFPILDEFFKKKTGKSLELVPKFYAGSIEEMKEVFVFENLVNEGFSLSKEKYVFSTEQTLLVMKEYGKLHGISFALKDQDEQTFNDITKDLPEVLSLLYDSIRFGYHAESCCKLMEKHLQSPEDSTLLGKIQYISKNAKNLFLKPVEYNGEHRVILHGDCNYNNIMFRNKKNHLEVRLMDFQVVRLNSPVLDPLYFFYSSASSEEHLAELDFFLKTYYDSLSATIKELGSDPEKLCPFVVIKEHWKKFSVFALIMTMVMLPMMLNDGKPVNVVENIERPTNNQDQALIISNEDEFAKRFKHLLQHFVDNEFV